MTRGVCHATHRCRYRHCRFTLSLARLCLGVLDGCQTQEKHYTLRGRVVAKSPGTGQLTVDNEDIPGFMPAMTMPYPVKDPRGLAQSSPEIEITADVVVKMMRLLAGTSHHHR